MFAHEKLSSCEILILAEVCSLRVLCSLQCSWTSINACYSNHCVLCLQHLAPGLRVVDLSHNRLSKTSKFLQVRMLLTLVFTQIHNWGELNTHISNIEIFF